MSISVMSQVWELELPRDQKLVLMALADHANDDGFTYPSLARVAWKCGYEQTRTVSQIVQKLLEAGVLVLIEKAHGRVPTLYRIFPDRGQSLPPFDPANYQNARARQASSGAVSAPQQPSGEAKVLNQQEEPRAPTSYPAKNAPQAIRSGAEGAPQRKPVAVRSDPVAVRFGGRSGAVASAPESLTVSEPRRARAREGARASAAGDPELFKLNNSARNLGIYPKTESETIESFRRRVDEAHKRKLEWQLEKRKTAEEGDDTSGAPSAEAAAS